MSKKAESPVGRLIQRQSQARHSLGCWAAFSVICLICAGEAETLGQETPRSEALVSQSTGASFQKTPAADAPVSTQQDADEQSKPIILETAAPAAASVSKDKAGAAEKTQIDDENPASVDPRVNMLNGDLIKNWKVFSSKEDVAPGDVWKVVTLEKERTLICVGEPKGYLFTQQQYDNFELTFEWKYTSDPNGNSGVLVFTKDEPRLWPTSMQIQLHQPRAGSIFPSGDATSDSTTEASDLALEIGKWNVCRVVAVGGRVSVEINGKPAGEVSGCNPFRGSIALQSEGSETHFRRMLLRKIVQPVESVVAPASPLPSSAKGTPGAEPNKTEPNKTEPNKTESNKTEPKQGD